MIGVGYPMTVRAVNEWKEHAPTFLGRVCTYRYLVNGKHMTIAIDQSGFEDNWDNRTWEFFDVDTGTHLNNGVVWHVDDLPVPTYNDVYECVIIPIIEGAKR